MIKWVTFYLWAPPFWVLRTFVRILVALLEAIIESDWWDSFTDWVGDVVDSISKGVSNLPERLGRKRKPDMESQGVNDGGDSNTNEKGVDEKGKGKSPE